MFEKAYIITKYNEEYEYICKVKLNDEFFSKYYLIIVEDVLDIVKAYMIIDKRTKQVIKSDVSCDKYYNMMYSLLVKEKSRL